MKQGSNNHTCIMAKRSELYDVDGSIIMQVRFLSYFKAPVHIFMCYSHDQEGTNCQAIENPCRSTECIDQLVNASY